MDTSLLREFVAIADKGNLESAAYELFTTPSSLSKHIKKLETELHVVLFEKVGRNNRLTPAGEAFLEYTRQILNLEDDARIMLKEYQGQYSDILKIAAVPHLGAYHISEILIQFQQHNPDIHIQLSSTSKTTVQRMLLDHSAELAFLRYAPWDDMSQYHVIPFSDDELCIICSQSHPLAKYDSVKLSFIHDEKFLGYSPQSFMNRFTTESCLDAGFNPNVTFIAQGVENIVELVSNGIGIALTMYKPVLYSSSNNSKIKIVRINPPYKCRVDLCYLKSKKLSSSALNFIREVSNYLNTNGKIQL